MSLTIDQKAQILLEKMQETASIRLRFDLGDAREIKFDAKKEQFYYLHWSPRENTGEPREYLTVEEAWNKVLATNPNLLA